VATDEACSITVRVNTREPWRLQFERAAAERDRLREMTPPRDPTPEMLDAAWHARSGSFTDIWQAMFDASALTRGVVEDSSPMPPERHCRDEINDVKGEQ
jgi:hypothetical protein